jgi:hypothetical protein
MKTYQVHIDVPLNDSWEDIEVESHTVEAMNAKHAEEIVTLRYSNSGVEDFYVWEVTEDDVVN